jgi:hypothetical protein
VYVEHECACLTTWAAVFAVCEQGSRDARSQASSLNDNSSQSDVQSSGPTGAGIRGTGDSQRGRHESVTTRTLAAPSTQTPIPMETSRRRGHGQDVTRSISPAARHDGEGERRSGVSILCHRCR